MESETFHDKEKRGSSLEIFLNVKADFDDEKSRQTINLTSKHFFYSPEGTDHRLSYFIFNETSFTMIISCVGIRQFQRACSQ